MQSLIVLLWLKSLLLCHKMRPDSEEWSSAEILRMRSKWKMLSSRRAKSKSFIFFNEAQPARHLGNLGKSMKHIQDCTLWFGVLWSLRPNDVEICWRALLQEKMRHMEESIKQAKGRGREISCSCFVHSVCIMHPYHIIATKRLVVWFSRNNAKFYGICTYLHKISTGLVHNWVNYPPAIKHGNGCNGTSPIYSRGFPIAMFDDTWEYWNL